MPAWPIPIHQTKLTIAKPQPMGMLMPQIPTPLMMSQAIDMNSTITIAESQRKSRQPAQPERAGENDRGDLVGDRGVGVPWFEHRIEPADFGRIYRRLRDAHAFSSSGFGLRTAARYVVRGRALSSPRIE